MEPIDQALAALEALKPGESLNYTTVTKIYGVNRSTLSKRHRGLQSSRDIGYENQQLLNDQQEKTLIKYIDLLTARDLPPSRQILRNFTTEICGREPGKTWISRFLKKHDLDLISKYTINLDKKRSRADSAYKYSLYFELIRQKIEEYQIEPRYTYNIDKKGFLIRVLAKIKRIFSRLRYKEGGIRQLLQDGNREWITIITCICADGTTLSPGLIY